MGVRQVGVGVAVAEILEGDAIDDGAGRRAEHALDDRRRVRPGHRMHGVELHAKVAAAKQRGNGVEVEQLRHQLGIVRHRIENLDHHIADATDTNAVNVHIGAVGDAVGADRFCFLIDRLRYLLRCRAAVSDIILDAEILVRTAGVMARRQHDPAVRLGLADHARRRRCGQNAAPPDTDAAEAIGGGNLQDHLDGLAVIVSSVATDDQGLPLISCQCIEYRLHEVLKIVDLFENADLLSQSRRSGFLAFIGNGGDGFDVHIGPSPGS